MMNMLGAVQLNNDAIQLWADILRLSDIPGSLVDGDGNDIVIEKFLEALRVLKIHQGQRAPNEDETVVWSSSRHAGDNEMRSVNSPVSMLLFPARPTSPVQEQPTSTSSAGSNEQRQREDRGNLFFLCQMPLSCRMNTTQSPNHVDTVLAGCIIFNLALWHQLKSQRCQGYGTERQSLMLYKKCTQLAHSAMVQNEGVHRDALRLLMSSLNNMSSLFLQRSQHGKAMATLRYMASLLSYHEHTCAQVFEEDEYRGLSANTAVIAAILTPTAAKAA